jgi:hypothetical protein
VSISFALERLTTMERDKEIGPIGGLICVAVALAVLLMA